MLQRANKILGKDQRKNDWQQKHNNFQHTNQRVKNYVNVYTHKKKQAKEQRKATINETNKENYKKPHKQKTDRYTSGDIDGTYPKSPATKKNHSTCIAEK